MDTVITIIKLLPRYIWQPWEGSARIFTGTKCHPDAEQWIYCVLYVSIDALMTPKVAQYVINMMNIGVMFR